MHNYLLDGNFFNVHSKAHDTEYSKYSKNGTAQRPRNKNNYRTQGTETTQQEPREEQQAGRTHTAKPTNREATRAKAAAEEREEKKDHRTAPVNERTEERTNQEEQPPDKAKPTTRRNGTATRERPKPTQNEERDMTSTPQKQHLFLGAGALNQGRAYKN